MTQAAVVILNYNGRNYLEKFLPSVLKYSGDNPVYVVDNGSDDGSDILVTEQFQRAHLIKLGNNMGFTGGYNQALKEIKAEIFILLNSDVEVTPNWIEPGLQLMLNDRSIAACQPKLISFGDRSRFEYAGAGGGFIDFLGFPFCRGRLFQDMEKDHGQYDDVLPVFWASGACLFIRSKVFFEVGGFDEDFFAHMEEIDLCWRIQNAGYQIFYNGKSKVYHVGGGTLSKSNPRKTYLNFRNGLAMLVKNESPGTLWWKLPLRASFDFLAMFKFTFFDSINDGYAVLKAHFHFWLKIVYIIRKRNLTKSQWADQLNEIPSIYPGSIVVDYYLRKKKKFSQLNFSPKSNFQDSL